MFIDTERERVTERKKRKGKRERFAGEKSELERRRNAAKQRCMWRCRLRKEVSPALERKSHYGISDGKNVFFSDVEQIERAQTNVKDDKWRSTRKHKRS